MKPALPFYSVSVIWRTPAFAFVLVVFLCGAIVGTFTGMVGDGAGSVQRLANFLTSGVTSLTPTLRQAAYTICGALLWPVLCVCTGFLHPPRLFLSALVAVRGFTLSFAVSAVITRLGARGIWLSLVTTGFQSILTIPCLLVISAAAFTASTDAPNGQGYWYALSRYRSALAVCALLSLSAALLRVILAPLLLALS